MAHRVSAAALVAAREVLKEYQLVVRPENCAVGMTNSEGHVAIVIDLASGAHKVAELRLEHYYWQQRLNVNNVEASQIASYLLRVVETFREVPQYKSDEQPLQVTWQLPPGVAMLPPTTQISKASVEAARYLLHYYHAIPMDGHELVPLDKMRVAMRVEAGLRMEDTLRAAALAQMFLERLKNNQATKKDIRQCFKYLGVLLENLPNYADRREETMLLT